MPNFILFFGVLINAAEHRVIYIAEDDMSKSRLICIPVNDGSHVHVPLDVPYQQAKTEWEALLNRPPAHSH